MTSPFSNHASTASSRSALTARKLAPLRHALWIGFLALTFAACSSESTEDPEGSGTGGAGGVGASGGLGGDLIGTDCSPAEACAGEPTGCTECPATKLCVVNIISGNDYSYGGDISQSVTKLKHSCIDMPTDCEGGTCTCEDSGMCNHGDCIDALPSAYDDVGNLVEVSEGAVYCHDYDG